MQDWLNKTANEGMVRKINRSVTYVINQSTNNSTFFIMMVSQSSSFIFVKVKLLRESQRLQAVFRKSLIEIKILGIRLVYG